MRLKTIVVLVVITICFACKNKHQENEVATTTSDLLYQKGEKITNTNFVGDVWLNSLVTADSINRNALGSVTFEPGARTNWHFHPTGQIILALEGEGLYQEKGSQKRILKKGDVVKCPANIPHWHGASAGNKFIQVAITGRDKGPTEWLEPVTDEEYQGE
mgnify:CR=1 FL=1|tara:strand:- start:1682 stop:2161 length:480 start_codon:yes stop_codon:yes gene_type:complete